MGKEESSSVDDVDVDGDGDDDPCWPVDVQPTEPQGSKRMATNPFADLVLIEPKATTVSEPRSRKRKAPWKTEAEPAPSEDEEEPAPLEDEEWPAPEEDEEEPAPSEDEEEPALSEDEEMPAT